MQSPLRDRALGAAIFNPVSQKLIAAHGWKMAFAIIGVMMLAVVIPLALIFAKKRPEDVGLATDGDDPEEARKIAAMMAAAMQKEIQFTMAEVSKTPNFWFMALGWLIMASCGGFLLHIVAYCMEKGISAAEAAWALGYMALVGVASRFFWAPVNDRLNNRKVSVVSGLFIYSIGWIALLMMQKTRAPLYCRNHSGVWRGRGSPHAGVGGGSVRKAVHGKDLRLYQSVRCHWRRHRPGCGRLGL